MAVPQNQIANANNFTLLNQPRNNVNTPSSNTFASSISRAMVDMSLGGSSPSNALDSAVKALVGQGVVVVVAGGNDGNDVGTSSPADVAEAITVGAMDVHDAVPSFNAFGDKIDIFAPGVDVISLGIADDNASQVLSGTSMATPHITGLSALLLGEDPTLTPAQVKTKIQSLAFQSALGSSFHTGTGTQNRLAQNGF